MLCLTLSVLSSGTISFAATPSDAEIIAKADASYYNLRGHSLLRFHCTLVPNFEQLVREQMKSSSKEQTERIQLLNQLRFEVLYGKTGIAQVSHNIVDVDTEQELKVLKQVSGGIDQIIEGFFNTWSMFMEKGPLSPTEFDKVEDLGTEYRVSKANPGTTKSEVLMDKSVLITRVSADAPEFTGWVEPQFEKTPDGLVLSSYKSEYADKGNSPARLSVGIVNQEVSGFRIPRKLNISVSATNIQLEFTDCIIEKR
jgi:hypothetical protein